MSHPLPGVATATASEREPLRVSAQGDPTPTFRQLFDEQLPYVLRVVRYLGAAPSDAEDVAQEVFVVAHRKLDTFEGRGSVQSWLYGICRRVLSDHRKRAYRRREVPTEEVRPGAQEPSQESDLAFGRALASLRAALDGLDEAQKTVFLLYEVEQLTMKEITEAMGTPLQTGYTRLHAARAHVKRRGAEGGR